MFMQCLRPTLKFTLDIPRHLSILQTSSDLAGRTALHMAAFSGEEQIVQWLLSEG